MSGLYISYNTILLAFTLPTTVQQANAILNQIGAEIVGGLPGAIGEVEGALVVRVPNTTHQQMISTLATLKSNSNVRVAVQDVLLEESAIPQGNGGSPTGWTWETNPSTTNWNLERIRAPQMWNLNAALQKENGSVQIAVLDTGFVTHPDLQIATSLGTSDHGTQVSGVLGATFNNQLGIDGVNPFVTILPTQTDATLGTTVAGRKSGGQIILNNFYTIVGIRKTINISLNYNWYLRNIDTNANTQSSIDARNVANEQGLYATLVLGSLFRPLPLAKRPFITVSAGNDNVVAFPTPQTARWSSPFTNAAIQYNQPNIIVVEGINDQVPVGRFSASNVGDGFVSAPAANITTTAANGSYITASGTSLAAPHIAGLAGYLFSLDPSLTVADIRQLISNSSVPVNGMAGYINSYAAVMSLDVLRGNKNVLKRLIDIDDGTLDGNQRTIISSANAANTDNNNDGIADAAVSSEQPLTITSTDFGSITSTAVVGEDVDNDGGVGDGTIDMSDFRRWRDWYAGANLSSGGLNGSASHFKKDVNSHPKAGINPTVDGNENTYARGDFNGDGGMASFTTTAVVPGFANPVTDLEVLQQSGLWQDSFYTTAHLSQLDNSGDLEIWIRDLYNLPGVVTVLSNVQGDPAGVDRIHTSGNPRHIYTLPPGTYTARIGAIDGAGNLVVGLKKQFTIAGGGDDQIWGPLVRLTPAPITLYNGPNDDCQRLQGQYGVDVRGLWNGSAPNIDIVNNQMAMYVNGSGFNVIERNKLNNWPLTVEAKSIRHCNFTQGQKGMGWEFDYGFTSNAIPEGFYTYIGDDVINIQDNRRRSRMWNLSNTTAPTGGLTCTGVPVNFTITSNFPGETTQSFSNVTVGANREILVRDQSTYTITATSADPNNTFNYNVNFGPNIPGFKDAKATYQAQQAWLHLFLIRSTSDSSCSSNLVAPNASNSQLVELNEFSMLSAPDKVSQPLNVERPKF